MSDRRSNLPDERTIALQAKLYQAAKRGPNRCFHALYDKLYLPYVLQVAWEQVRKNRGAAAINRQTLDEIEHAHGTPGVEQFRRSSRRPCAGRPTVPSRCAASTFRRPLPGSGGCGGETDGLADGEGAASAGLTRVAKDTLLARARALSGPQVEKYRVESNSRPGAYYELTVDAGEDVTCACPGFEYRGACSHARTPKTALARGTGLPAGYRPMGEEQPVREDQSEGDGQDLRGELERNGSCRPLLPGEAGAAGGSAAPPRLYQWGRRPPAGRG